jgi:hypothetical protein
MLAPTTSACGGVRRLTQARTRRCRALPGCVASAAPVDEDGNPQNAPAPECLPAPELSVEECVRVQLAAAQRNHEPRRFHGIHVLYEFCASAGGMERSSYFGVKRDIYHVDHYMSLVATRYPALFSSECTLHRCAARFARLTPPRSLRDWDARASTRRRRCCASHSPVQGRRRCRAADSGLRVHARAL